MAVPGVMGNAPSTGTPTPSRPTSRRLPRPSPPAKLQLAPCSPASTTGGVTESPANGEALLDPTHRSELESR